LLKNIFLITPNYSNYFSYIITNLLYIQINKSSKNSKVSRNNILFLYKKVKKSEIFLITLNFRVIRFFLSIFQVISELITLFLEYIGVIRKINTEKVEN
jgi:hypothetical protein